MKISSWDPAMHFFTAIFQKQKWEHVVLWRGHPGWYMIVGVYPVKQKLRLAKSCTFIFLGLRKIWYFCPPMYVLYTGLWTHIPLFPIFMFYLTFPLLFKYFYIYKHKTKTINVDKLSRFPLLGCHLSVCPMERCTPFFPQSIVIHFYNIHCD